MSTKKAMNLAMSEKTRDRLESLKVRMDSDSFSEVIRRSIELMEVLVEHKAAGDSIILRSQEGSEKEIIISQ